MLKETIDIATPDLLLLTMLGSVQMLNGSVCRVCAASAASVRVATVKALNRMRIKVASIDKGDGNDRILAVSGERNIEVEVEQLGHRSTRMRISAKQGGDNDILTAAEVIAQTEQLLSTTPEYRQAL